MTSALRQITLAIRDIIEPALTGTQVFIDRSVADPLNTSELPGVVIRPGQFDIERLMGTGTQMWRGVIDFDIFSASSTLESIDETHLRIASEIVVAMADDPYIGGRVSISEPSSIAPSDDSLPDIGAAVLTFQLVFETRADDWNTIIGPGGIFT